MSFVAQNIVLDHSRSKGAARLVFLALCRYIKHELWKEGEPAEAYPSQSTLAAKCNCSRSSVERGLEQLLDLGEIRDTGERWRRSTVIYHLALLDEVRDGLRDVTQDGSGDMTQGGSLTQDGSGEADGGADLTQFGNDLTQIVGDLTHPGQNLTQDEALDGCKAVVKKGLTDGSSDALDIGSPSGDLSRATATAPPPSTVALEPDRLREEDQLLDDLEQQHREDPKDRTLRGINSIRERQGRAPLPEAAEVAA